MSLPDLGLALDSFSDLEGTTEMRAGGQEPEATLMEAVPNNETKMSLTHPKARTRTVSDRIGHRSCPDPFSHGAVAAAPDKLH